MLECQFLYHYKRMYKYKIKFCSLIMYPIRANIRRGLYFSNHFLYDKNCYLMAIVLKILAVCTVSIQEQSIIKSGLRVYLLKASERFSSFNQSQHCSTNLVLGSGPSKNSALVLLFLTPPLVISFMVYLNLFGLTFKISRTGMKIVECI